MSKDIIIRTESTWEHEEIQTLLYGTSVDEGAESDSEVVITKVVGVTSPLLKINDIVVDFPNIRKMILRSNDHIPTIEIRFMDPGGLIKSFDTPDADVMIYLQVLPAFDGVYKKISLAFHATEIKTLHNNNISMSGILDLPGMNDSKLLSWGNIDMLSAIDKIAEDTGIGVATNIDNMDDYRWMYLSNQSYVDFLYDEVNKSGNKFQVTDWWVDWWNNLCLIDIYDTLKGELTDDPRIYISSRIQSVDNQDIEGLDSPLILTNNRVMGSSQLYFDDMRIIRSNDGNASNGTDRIMTVFDINSNNREDTVVMDGKVSSKVYTKYIYKGEWFNEDTDSEEASDEESNEWNPSNLLIQEEFFSVIKQKMDNTNIEIILKSPVLGLMKGMRVNLEYYDYDIQNINLLVDKEESIDTDTVIDTYDASEQELMDPAIGAVNLSISGQYTITDMSLIYTSNGVEPEFKHKLTIARDNNSLKYMEV